MISLSQKLQWKERSTHILLLLRLEWIWTKLSHWTSSRLEIRRSWSSSSELQSVRSQLPSNWNRFDYFVAIGRKKIISLYRRGKKIDIVYLYCVLLLPNTNTMKKIEELIKEMPRQARRFYFGVCCYLSAASLLSAGIISLTGSIGGGLCVFGVLLGVMSVVIMASSGFFRL